MPKLLKDGVKNKREANGSPATHQTLGQQGGTAERQPHSSCRLDSQRSSDREEEEQEQEEQEDGVVRLWIPSCSGLK